MFIKLLIIGLVIFIVYRIWKRTQIKFWTYRENALNKKSKDEGKMAELVKDPVCNTFIEKSNAIEYGGKHFCSELCKEKFIKEREVIE